MLPLRVTIVPDKTVGARGIDYIGNSFAFQNFGGLCADGSGFGNFYHGVLLGEAIRKLIYCLHNAMILGADYANFAERIKKNP